METWADRYECSRRERAGGHHAVFLRTQRQPSFQLGALQVVGLGRIMLVFGNVIKRNQRFNSNARGNGAFYDPISRY